MIRIATKGVDNLGRSFDVFLTKDASGRWIVNADTGEWYLASIANVRGALSLDFGAGLIWSNAVECIREAIALSEGKSS